VSGKKITFSNAMICTNHVIADKFSFTLEITVLIYKKEWTTPDFRNTPSTTNLEEEEIVDAPGNDGNASLPEEFKRPNLCRKMKMMMF